MARIAAAATPLALLVALAQPYGFATAAIVDGVYTILLAVLGPFRGRLVDRFGARRALVPMAAIASVALGLVAVSVTVVLPWQLTLVFVVLAGAAAPPISAALRVEWSEVVGGDADLTRVAHSLDSLLEESAFVVGPLLAGLGLATMGGAASYSVAAGLTIASTIVYLLLYVIRSRRAAPMSTEQAASTDESPTSELRGPVIRILGALSSVSVLRILAPLAAMGFVFGGIDVYAPAYATHLGAVGLSGVILAMVSVGGVIGGVWYSMASWDKPLWHKYIALTFGFGMPILGLVLASNVWVMCILLALAGLAVTPLYINAYLLVDSDVPRPIRHEANLWLGASTDLANGASAILVGLLVSNALWFEARASISALALVCLTLLTLLFAKSGATVSRRPDRRTPVAGRSDA
ncbi:hypothetical protein H489_0106885 [Curtobacterium flaccumfaciens UCD-AKU]|uniref:MFS transporter n=1 Tax=Curtobacterium flaccumfaciens TaxID=2035 RepID=UPI0003755D90|nr:MFS transporter [Curtobacterium flaccumfaciens]EYT65570.1 hypothetical protein H489_0106885 [Curtobacterium flaccumfaciens UCD-AKU]